MKYKLIIILVVMAMIASCSDSGNNNTHNYYANIKTEFYTLHAGNWKLTEGSTIQWYQQFALPKSDFNDFDYAGVMCYYLNQYGAWEALPSTRIFWTDNDVVYSDELWFSNDLNYLYIDYRNTIPGPASPPKDPLKIKAVYFDDTFIGSKTYKEINWSDYMSVKNHLNLKD